MRLATLILEELEPILQDFEDFARSHTGAGADMDVTALRDHAEQMLRAFAADMGEAQTEDAQRLKSYGDAPDNPDSAPTAAAQHGHARASEGFTLQEMFAEYRALRASVMRHWMTTREGAVIPEVDELIRFNEAIDQAVAESITRYAATVGEYREMFLAVLGHDLRTPISAVITAAAFLSENSELSESSMQLARSIQRSADRMNGLVNDLLDFTLSRLGRGIPIERRRADLTAAVRDTVEEVRITNPGRDFRFDASGPVEGEWDVRRVSQALSNLVSNAVQHGAPNSPITIVVFADGDDGVVSVRNRGRLIPPTELAHIFEPFRRHSSGLDRERDRNSLGLGLHIARQIAAAHGGAIEVESDPERGTTFSLRLPRAGRGA